MEGKALMYKETTDNDMKTRRHEKIQVHIYLTLKKGSGG